MSRSLWAGLKVHAARLCTAMNAPAKSTFVQRPGRAALPDPRCTQRNLFTHQTAFLGTREGATRGGAAPPASYRPGAWMRGLGQGAGRPCRRPSVGESGDGPKAKASARQSALARRGRPGACLGGETQALGATTLPVLGATAGGDWRLEGLANAAPSPTVGPQVEELVGRCAPRASEDQIGPGPQAGAWRWRGALIRMSPLARALRASLRRKGAGGRLRKQ